MNTFAIAGLTCGITTSVFAVVSVIYGKTKIQRVLAWFNISVAIWGFGGFLVGTAQSEQAALAYWRFAQAGGTFIAIFFYHMIYLFCNLHRRNVLKLVYAWGFVFLFLQTFTGLLFERTFEFYGVQFYNSATVLYGILVVTWCAVVIMSFIHLLLSLPKAIGTKRIQTIYIIFGFLCGFIGGASTLIPMFGISIPPFGNFTIVLYCFISTYAILKYRILDFNVAITRAGIFLILYTGVLGAPFYIGYLTGSWVLSTSVAVLLASIGPIAYRAIQRRAEDLILSEQRRYQKILIQAAEGMAREHELKRLLNLIVHVVTRIVRVRFAAVYLFEKDVKKYSLKAMRDHKNVFLDFKVDENDNLGKFLSKHKDPFLVEELPLELKEFLMEKCNASLVVPSFINEQPLGFMILGEKINEKTYSEDDIRVFKLLSQQTTMAIENCMFFEESQRSQERIFAAEKLAAIGGMADGVAHQIRNRLNHFSIVAGEQQFEIGDLKTKFADKDPELNKSLDYLLQGAKSIIDNVKKTAIMIDGILNFARVDEKSKLFSEFALEKVVDASREVIKTKHQIADIPINTDYGNNGTVYGVEVQIRECIYNLLDNAYEAVKEKAEHYLKSEHDKIDYLPEINLRLLENSGSRIIEIRDNGIGIKDAHKSKIFSPFFTTKPSVKSGTGIGMYVVKRMIEENHKGKVTFESEYGKGTKIVVEIPKAPSKGTMLT